MHRLSLWFKVRYHRLLHNSYSIMKKTFKKFLNELKSNKSYLQYIIVFLSFAFIMTSYEDDLKCLFDEMVMPILSEFRANAFSFVLVCILVFVVASDIKRKWSYRYRFDGRWTFVLFCILFVTLRYRFTGLYNYVPWLWLVSYVDICIVAGLSYLIVAITNKIRINANKQDSLYSYFAFAHDNHNLEYYLNERECRTESDRNLFFAQSILILP